MKRYKISSFSFDSRPTTLNLEIKNEWEDKIKELHSNNKEIIKQEYINEFGLKDFEQKILNIRDLGNMAASVIAFHNKFLSQIRNSFIICSYYPSLVGASALGERILNHLILKLRSYFINTPKYKSIYKKKSFDNWEAAIEILKSWNVLLSDVEIKFNKLIAIRNKAIHFTPETDSKDRSFALEAIYLISDNIEELFAVLGKQPWFIENT